MNNQMKFTEAKLEQAFTSLLAKEGYTHFVGDSIIRLNENSTKVMST